MAASVPSLTFQPPPSATRFSTRESPPSPPATPSQRLLDAEPSHVQMRICLAVGFPPPLRGWYAIALVVVLLLLAIALELALHFTEKNNGWKTHGNVTNGVMHYVYVNPSASDRSSSCTLILIDPVYPGLTQVQIVALWAWTDIEIKKMQPYVDLVRVWTAAARNRHWVVTGASIMVLITLCFQPLASALLSVRNTWIPLPDVTLNTLSTVSLNQSAEFQDLTIFLTASGYASASVGYNLQQPPFVWNQYTVTPFQIPTDLATNGTLLANTTAVKTDTNCAPVSVNMAILPDGSGWNNSLSFNNTCFLQWSVDRNATNLFGTNTLDCGDSTPPQFQPVVFWFFTYQPSAKASATVCTPRITLWDTAVTLDLGSGNVTNVHELRPFDASTSKFGSLSGNLTGAPLFGRAYNGVNFTLTNPDKFVIARMNATQLTMPAAVFQAAVQSSPGLVGSFDADLFVEWSNDVYVKYLTLIAKAVYFITNAEPIVLQVKTFQQRLWMSELATHLLAALLIILALCAAVIHIFHRYERQDLNLLHQPGTIASAVSIGATTEMGQLLAKQRDAEGIHQALQDKRFRIDPYNMKILMEGEEGYGAVGSPMDRRRSVFGAMQGKRASRRFSRAPGSPGLPQSPRTPQSAAASGAAV
ncbi:Non-specific serine/threonine protein kinase [Mycena venus]|uniref:Non-specific serine/threonine protein kinase n=1 Tax=Mycena venus TaxID=2733690 RepID=A0A8H7CYW3_9AGAR|nr:Non-specific serine/threonine protein kinase [Mycena venus]